MYGDPAASPGTLQERVVKLEVEFHAHWASQQALRAGQNPPACLDASSPGEAETPLSLFGRPCLQLVLQPHCKMLQLGAQQPQKSCEATPSISFTFSVKF